MENKHHPKRAAGQLTTDSARETGSGESKLTEPSLACNLYQGPDPAPIRTPRAFLYQHEQGGVSYGFN
jgi:hypothetical protein